MRSPRTNPSDLQLFTPATARGVVLSWSTRSPPQAMRHVEAGGCRDGDERDVDQEERPADQVLAAQHRGEHAEVHDQGRPDRQPQGGAEQADKHAKEEAADDGENLFHPHSPSSFMTAGGGSSRVPGAAPAARASVPAPGTPGSAAAGGGAPVAVGAPGGAGPAFWAVTAAVASTSLGAPGPCVVAEAASPARVITAVSVSSVLITMWTISQPSSQDRTAYLPSKFTVLVVRFFTVIQYVHCVALARSTWTSQSTCGAPDCGEVGIMYQTTCHVVGQLCVNQL